MARLMGVDLPRDKRMEIALTYIYGVGRTRSQEILDGTGISRELRGNLLIANAFHRQTFLIHKSPQGQPEKYHGLLKAFS